jgi:transposase-like protein
MEITMENETRKYTPEYKAKVVIEALKSGKTIHEVALENDLNTNVLRYWKSEFVKKSPSVFDNPKVIKHRTAEKPFASDEYMKRIRELREERNMTQEKVAKYLGTSQTMYARYENGMSKMPIRHLLMLVQLYGVSSDYILGVTDRK